MDKTVLITPGPVTSGLQYLAAEAKLHARRFFDELAGGSDRLRNEICWAQAKGDLDRSSCDNECLSGHVPWLVERLRANGIAATFAWGSRRKVSFDSSTLDRFGLSDSQREAIHAMVHHRHGIIQLPTGDRGTHLVAGLALGVPRKWLYVLNREADVEQALASLRNPGVDAFELSVELLERAAHTMWAKFLRRIPQAARKPTELELRTARRTFAYQQTGRGQLWPKPPCVLVSTHQSLFAPSAEPVLIEASGLIVADADRVADRDSLEVARRTVTADVRVGLSSTPLQRRDGRDVLVELGVAAVIAAIILLIRWC